MQLPLNNILIVLKWNELILSLYMYIGVHMSIYHVIYMTNKIYITNILKI